jgi:hypothetical protein
VWWLCIWSLLRLDGTLYREVEVWDLLEVLYSVPSRSRTHAIALVCSFIYAKGIWKETIVKASEAASLWLSKLS